MFNSPLLDVTIGLVFIFLLYSLLATTVHEIVATIFMLRSRMLKRAIIQGMLSNTPDESIWVLMHNGINSFFNRMRGEIQQIEGPPTRLQRFLSLPLIRNIRNLIRARQAIPPPAMIGDRFFCHPLIKNYGSSRIFPLPSYITTKNFSTVLIDLLKQDFDEKTRAIALSKLSGTISEEQVTAAMLDLHNSTDIVKIRELLDYYGRHLPQGTPTFSLLERDTWQILQMHLNNSVCDIEKFTAKIESWYDDSMDRVSGWYKRQSQFILLGIGLFLAIAFNVDVIMVASKLSTDKDARDKLVEMAVKAADRYKDDPRVKKNITKEGVLVPDTASLDKVFMEYKSKADSAKRLIEGDLKTSNEIIAVGWGDYGMKTFKDNVLAANNIFVMNDFWRKHKSPKLDSCLNLAFEELCKTHWIKYDKTVYKVFYVAKASAHAKKILGFLILAFAVSLGAPFWFDMLNKLVKIRSAGSKEDGSPSQAASPAPAAAQPVTVNVHTNNTGEEAAG
ncbi:MAG: hypothetical protein WCK34_04525 [Bacteroidota bacterium]